MSRTEGRAIGLGSTLLIGLLLAASAWAPRARAQPLGPYFEPDALPQAGFDLRVGLRYAQVERTDFARPVFLFAQPVRRIEARELRAELDFRFSLSDALALQAVLPLTLRGADAELEGLLVSPDERLPPAEVELRGAGVSDPIVALAYRPLHDDTFGASFDAGTQIPIDDNPGSSTLPRRLPLGTGQTQLFLGVGGTLQLDAFSAALSYRFGFHPGSPATYLIRRGSAQSYSSGSLDAYLVHRISALLRYAFDPAFSLALAPELRLSEQPLLVDRNSSLVFLPEDLRTELIVELRFGWQLSAHHALELGYRHWALRSWDQDPFFPIAIPDQGVGLSWKVTAR